MGKGAKQQQTGSRYDVLDPSPDGISYRERWRQEQEAAKLAEQHLCAQELPADLRALELEERQRPRSTQPAVQPPHQGNPGPSAPMQPAHQQQHTQHCQGMKGYVLRMPGDASSDDDAYIFPPARQPGSSRRASSSALDLLHLPPEVVAEQQRLWEQLTAGRTPAAAQQAGKDPAAPASPAPAPHGCGAGTSAVAPATSPAASPAPASTTPSILGGALGALMRTHSAQRLQHSALPASTSQRAAQACSTTPQPCTRQQPLGPAPMCQASSGAMAAAASRQTSGEPTACDSSDDFPASLVEQQRRLWEALERSSQEPATAASSATPSQQNSQQQQPAATASGSSSVPWQPGSQPEPCAASSSADEQFPDALVEEQRRLWAQLDSQRSKKAAAIAAAEAAFAAAEAAAEAAAKAVAAAEQAGFELPVQLLAEQQRLWLQFAHSLGASSDDDTAAEVAAAVAAAPPVTRSWVSICETARGSGALSSGTSDYAPSSVSSRSSSPLPAVPTLQPQPVPGPSDFPALPAPARAPTPPGMPSSIGDSRRIRPNTLPAHYHVAVRRANSSNAVRVVHKAKRAAGGNADEVLPLRPGKADLHWDLRMEGLTEVDGRCAEAVEPAGHPSDPALKQRTLAAAEAHAAAEQQRRALHGSAALNGTSREALSSMMTAAARAAAGTVAGGDGPDAAPAVTFGSVSFQGIAEWRRLVAAMLAAGWEPLAGRSGGHSKFKRTLPLSGVQQVVTLSCSPSDALRGIKNTAADLQRQEREAARLEQEAALALLQQQ